MTYIIKFQAPRTDIRGGFDSPDAALEWLKSAELPLVGEVYIYEEFLDCPKPLPEHAVARYTCEFEALATQTFTVKYRTAECSYRQGEFLTAADAIRWLVDAASEEGVDLIGDVTVIDTSNVVVARYDADFIEMQTRPEDGHSLGEQRARDESSARRQAAATKVRELDLRELSREDLEFLVDELRQGR